jgi:hypothetical protein
MEKKEKGYKILAGKSEWKKSFQERRGTRIWVNNIHTVIYFSLEFLK